MASRKHRQADRAAREQAQSSTGPAAPEERGQLLSVYRERRRRQDEHDMEQRQLRAARKAAGPSATERRLMTATADSAAGTRTDWHLDFVRLHSARRVDLRGTPEMDPRLVNRLSTAERMAARQKHTLAVAALEKHAPAQARAYRLAFIDAGGLMGGASWERTPQAEAHAVETEVAALEDITLSVARERLRGAVRAIADACDGVVPEMVAAYTLARRQEIRRAERDARAHRWQQIRAGKVPAGAIRP